MGEKSMTFKTAVRRASEIRVYVRPDRSTLPPGQVWRRWSGSYIEATTAAIRRSDLYEDAPTGHPEALAVDGSGWTGVDSDGRIVWAFALGLLQIG